MKRFPMVGMVEVEVCSRYEMFEVWRTVVGVLTVYMTDLANIANLLESVQTQWRGCAMVAEEGGAGSPYIQSKSSTNRAILPMLGE